MKTDMKFKDKKFVITGANSGMGFAVAKQIITEGGKVLITGRSQPALDRAVLELGPSAISYLSDAGNLGDIRSLVEFTQRTFGKIDGVFANAGAAIFGPLEGVTESTYDSLMNLNVKGVFFLLQGLIPHLNDGASIVINASVTGTKSSDFTTVYAATKAAVLSLAKGFAAALVSRNIRVNAVSPGPIETPLWKKKGGMPEGMAEPVKQQIRDANPMKRFGTAEEVANAVTFLLSSQASYMTGSEILVDGGMVNL